MAFLVNSIINRLKVFFCKFVLKTSGSEKLKKYFKCNVWPHILSSEIEHIDSTRIKNIEGRYRGKRCFIIATGNSINDLDLGNIKDDFIMVLNKAFLLNGCFGKKPDAIIISDKNAYDEYGKDVPFDEFEYVFFPSVIKEKLHNNKTYIFSYWESPRLYDGFFNSDISSPIYHAHTVTAFAIQIAYYMGFEKIILCGVDLNYSELDRPHFYQSSHKELLRFRNISKKKEKLMIKGIDCLNGFLKKKGYYGLCSVSSASKIKGVPYCEYNELFDD